MVSVLVSYNNSILSHFIRSASKEPASHFAICFDQRLVFHSNLFGAHPTFRSTFEKSNTVFKEILIPNTTAEQEEAIYMNCLQFDGKPYDYMALLYLCTVGYAESVFLNKVPKNNPFNHDKYYLCTEVAKCLDPVVKLDMDLSITTPWKLINMIQEKVHG